MLRHAANLLGSGRLWLSAGVLAAFAFAPQPASAFYWPGWPGSGVTEPPAVPQQIIREIPPGKTPNEPTPSEPPKQVPEPATLVLAGIGLTGLGLARWRKRVR